MENHSNIAWKTPRTKEAGRLQAMESQKVRHDGATEHSVLKTIAFVNQS